MYYIIGSKTYPKERWVGVRVEQIRACFERHARCTYYFFFKKQ